MDIVSTPLEIEIIQPTLPRAIDLKEPKWYVVSDAKIVNPCKKDEETGSRPKMDHPEGLTNDKGKVIRVCKLGKENDWPDGYTYLDRFIDDIKKKHGGDIVFVAMSVADYELMAYNTQELKRYINQLGEVIVYYRNVTVNDEQAQALGIKVKEEK